MGLDELSDMNAPWCSELLAGRPFADTRPIVFAGVRLLTVLLPTKKWQLPQRARSLQGPRLDE